jgi:hypothetical protein
VPPPPNATAAAAAAPFPGAEPGSFDLVIQLRGVNGRARL